MSPVLVTDIQVVSSPPCQPELHLSAYTYSSRATLMPELGVAIDHAGGWLLERRTVSAQAMELKLEVTLPCLPDLYAAFVAVGVELTRDSHRAMAQRVSCDLHLRPTPGIGSILILCIDLHFLDPPATELHLPHRYRQAFARA